MAQVADTDLPIVGAPAEINTISLNEASPKKDAMDVNSTPEVEVEIPSIEPVNSVDSGSETEGLGGVKQVVLDSPFHSPKPAAEDDQSELSPKEGEILEEPLESMAAIQEVVVNDQDKRSESDKGTGNDVVEIEINDRQVSADPMENTQATGKASNDSTKDVNITATPLPTPNGVSASTDSSENTANEDDSVRPSEIEKAQETHVGDETTAVVGGNCVLEDDEDTAVETPTPTRPTPSVPPHMRPNFQPPATRDFGPQDTRRMMPTADGSRYSEGPRGPRPSYPPYQTYRGEVDREQLARLSAQLMKTKNELDVERKKNVNLRKSIEGEQQQKTEAAFTSMLADLLHKQAEALTLKANAERKERDLQYREQKIQQFEVYLTEGQKQVKYQLEEQGIRSMSTVELEHAQREAELSIKKSIADVEGKITIRLEGLRLREAAQQMREHQYKALIRDSIEAELHESALTSEKADEIAEVEYNRGYGAGKDAGRKEILEEGYKKGFLEGYAACHRAQAALYNVRHGRIPHDSPELEFLYDAGHPENLLTRGMQIGRLDCGSKREQMMNGAMRKELMMENKPIPEIKKEEPIFRAPPPRPTFASELRGTATMHNGHVVLANGSASPTPTPTPNTNGVNDVNTAERVGHEGEGIYAGRRMVRYDEIEEENLIDLLG